MVAHGAAAPCAEVISAKCSSLLKIITPEREKWWWWPEDLGWWWGGIPMWLTMYDLKHHLHQPSPHDPLWRQSSLTSVTSWTHHHAKRWESCRCCWRKRHFLLLPEPQRHSAAVQGGHQAQTLLAAHCTQGIALTCSSTTRLPEKQPPNQPFKPFTWLYGPNLSLSNQNKHAETCKGVAYLVMSKGWLSCESWYHLQPVTTSSVARALFI